MCRVKLCQRQEEEGAVAMDASGASSSSSSSALSRWQLENNVQTLSPDELESIIKDDKDRQQMIQSQRPWQKDPHYFKNVGALELCLVAHSDRHRACFGRPKSPRWL